MLIIGIVEVAFGLLFILSAAAGIRRAMRSELPDGFVYSEGSGRRMNPLFIGFLGIAALVAGLYSLWLAWQLPAP